MDRLTAIMLIVINTVSALVHLYSFGYMAHDENFKEGEHYKARFFAYLSFFTFAMLMREYRGDESLCCEPGR